MEYSFIQNNTSSNFSDEDFLSCSKRSVRFRVASSSSNRCWCSNKSCPTRIFVTYWIITMQKNIISAKILPTNSKPSSSNFTKRCLDCSVWSLARLASSFCSSSIGDVIPRAFLQDESSKQQNQTIASPSFLCDALLDAKSPGENSLITNLGCQRWTLIILITFRFLVDR